MKTTEDRKKRFKEEHYIRITVNTFERREKKRRKKRSLCTGFLAPCKSFTTRNANSLKNDGNNNNDDDDYDEK